MYSQYFVVFIFNYVKTDLFTNGLWNIWLNGRMKACLAAYSGLLQTSTIGDYAKIVSDVIFSSKRCILDATLCHAKPNWNADIFFTASRYRGVVVITTAQLYSTKPELRFCAGSKPARDVSEIRGGEYLWQWFRLEIRLNAFCRSTIPQK